MAHPSNLSSTAAVQSQGHSYLFYCKADGQGIIAYLKSKHEKEDDKPYEHASIDIDGNVVAVSTQSPQITAVSYKYDGKHEIRVYYISVEGYLREICRTNGGDWYEGSLSKANVDASPKSLLTASVDHSDHGQLKLYYNRKDDVKLWCTFVNVGSTSWSMPKCVQGQL